MPRISILVPIYGVENYIQRCVDSLFAQTLDDLEFIFVDDCSPDRSIELLTERINKERNLIAEKRWTVRVEHLPINKGLPFVRQYAISLATGEYIIHCDSDDWVSPDTCRLLYEKAIRDSADIVVCDYAAHDGNDVSRRVTGCSSVQKDAYINNLLSMKDPWSLWNKIVKAELYKTSNIHYPRKNMGEDLALYLQLVLHAKRVSYLPQVLYFYFYNPTSISRAKSIEHEYLKFQQFHENVEIVQNAFISNDLADKYELSLISLKWKAKKNLWRLTYDDYYYQIWKDTYPEVFNRFIINPYISLGDKLRCVLTYLRVYPQRKDFITK